ncbi:hypothetical protein KY347_06205 [Candidatus Woesearchaeota archaeon]|nr:hypothetical protein [Candidatus Woesearchaeota archaeon]
MELSDRVSCENLSRDIYTPHFCGYDNQGSTLEVIPEGAPFNDVYNEFPLSSGFREKTSAQTWNELMDYSITLTSVGDSVVFTTSGNNFVFTKNDIVKYGCAHSWDESMDMMNGWIGATFGQHSIEYVKPPEFTELTVSRYERLADSVTMKYVTDIVGYYGPINELGIQLSKAETLRQDLNRYEESREGKELAIEKGMREDIEHVGVVSHKGTVYEIVRFKNGKIRLSTGTEAYKYLSKEAEEYGVTLEDMIIASLGEEDMHLYRKSFDKMLTTRGRLIREERETKQKLLAFYTRLAKEAENNPKLRDQYMKVIEAIKDDIETVERYGDDSRPREVEKDEGKSSGEESELEEKAGAGRKDNDTEPDPDSTNNNDVYFAKEVDKPEETGENPQEKTDGDVGSGGADAPE